MLVVHPNYFNLAGRVVALILLAALLYLLHKLLLVQTQKAILALYFLFLLFSMAIIVVITSFLGIIRVQIDKTSGIFTFKGIFAEKAVLKTNICGYYNTFSYSRRKTFYGLLIVLVNGTRIAIDEYNLKSVNEVEQYLQELHVEHLGRLRSRFPFSFKR